MVSLRIKAIQELLGKKKSKYGNVHTLCNQGYKHKSKGEALHCNKLFMAYPDCKIEHEKSYPIIVNGDKICSHIPDWTVTHPKTGISIVEFKGMETGVWKIKYKLFKALYPSLPYIVIKR